MRIISGEARGRVVRLPPGSHARPTSDRVKESLFNILHPVEGLSFLDLFAGSGNVGLEALSRGASFAVFVEKDVRLANAIKKNLVDLGFASRALIINAFAEKGLERLVKKGSLFDIIFVDPPYEKGFISDIMACPYLKGALNDRGVIIVQHSTREGHEQSQAGIWTAKDQKRYGDTVLSFFTGTGD